MDGLTLAVVAVALSPLAYWLIGPDEGRRPGGSSPWLRRLIGCAYLASLTLAAYDALVP